MAAFVYCIKDSTHYEKINLYLKFEGETYYLFTQHYSNTAWDRFKMGVRLDETLKHQSGLALKSFNEKLPKFIKYIEDTEGITVLKKTAKKNSRKMKCGRRCEDIREAA